MVYISIYMQCPAGINNTRNRVGKPNIQVLCNY